MFHKNTIVWGGVTILFAFLIGVGVHFWRVSQRKAFDNFMTQTKDSLVRGDYGQAISMAGNSISVDSKAALAYYFRGLAYKYHSDKHFGKDKEYFQDLAEKDLKYALQLNPNYENPAYYVLGTLYLDRNKFNNAKDTFFAQRATRESPPGSSSPNHDFCIMHDSNYGLALTHLKMAEAEVAETERISNYQEADRYLSTMAGCGTIDQKIFGYVNRGKLRLNPAFNKAARSSIKDACEIFTSLLYDPSYQGWVYGRSEDASKVRELFFKFCKR